MSDQVIIDTQLQFYRNGAAGCLFVAHAADNPEKYGWKLSVVDDTDTDQIRRLVSDALAVAEISTQSLIFPSVQKPDQLIQLLQELKSMAEFELETWSALNDYVCVGLRVVSGSERSWVTGFGNFDFLPKTRHTPFTEIIFRSKPRPDYDSVMKEAPAGVLHLADMDMKGMKKNKFQALWYGSFDKAETLLGHKPDILSAAKTTFAFPKTLWHK